jgi:23S rRNA pseudouridine1911/1915/1917 synthase
VTSHRPAIEVLHRTPSYAAINKPPGLSVAAERNKPGVTPLLDAIAAALQVPQVLVVHRLDRDTSGVLLVAITPEAHRDLSIQFQKRRTQKTYIALVRGSPAADEGVINAPLEKDPHKAGRMRVARDSGRPGKRSLTLWRVRARYRGYALLEVAPRTGRQHQIRVHLKHVGMPLAVDRAYGGGAAVLLSELKRGYKPPADRAEAPIIERVTLHAEALGFTDPASGEFITVRAEAPKDLRRAIDLLAKHASGR